MDVPLVPVPTTAADDDAAAGSPSPLPEMEMKEDGGGGGKVVYVAVSGNRNKALPTLRWALRRHAPAPEGRKKTALLVLVYVHRPATMIPIFRAKVPSIVLKDEIVTSYRQQERRITEKFLQQYLDICTSEKVQAEAFMIANDNIAHGLIGAIQEHKISTLIMGAGIYGKTSTQRTKLAITMEKEADPSCKILFVHKGNLFSIRPRTTSIPISVNSDVPTMAGSHIPWFSFIPPWHHDDRSSVTSSSFLTDSQTMTDNGLDPENLDHQFFENAMPMFDYDSFSLIRHESLHGLNEIASQIILSGHSQYLRQLNFDVSCNEEVRNRQFIHGIDSILGVDSMNLEEVYWKAYMEDKTIKWIYLLEYIHKIVSVSLKQIQEQHDGASSGLTLEGLSDAATKPINRLLTFASTVSKVNGSPEKLFHTLQMHKALSEASPMIQQALLGEQKEFFVRELHRILDTLEDSAREILGKLKVQIQSHDSPIIPGGSVHLVTTYLMRYITLLAHNTSSLNTILGHDHSDHLLAADGINLLLPSHLISGLIFDLGSMLQKQSKLYKPEGLQYLFLMNNEHFILQQFERGDIKLMIGTEWIQKYCHNINRYKVKYIEATWATVVSCLDKKISISLNFLQPSPLKEFISSFETEYRLQMHWKVPDPKLRIELRQTVCDYVLPAYCEFMEKHPNLEKSGDNLEDIRNKLNELFEG
ncbi:exocyst complex component EXO70B1-like isoform X2 [Oryza glaberrima]|uniref:exocyst complex component EXO70B1-like isoform X2 n=1 Tax=Oryza glaberrima TaxID=4538 RepID=UPI00224C5C00|nr:exocyst complex component EXO70B1-like isoform X2 [Oryza glaberrima]